jgi:hypothetical protein
MRKQITCSITLLIFSLYCVSCSSTKTVETAPWAVKQRKAHIVGLQTKAGDYIEFMKNFRATLKNGVISGLVESKYLELRRDGFEYGESSQPPYSKQWIRTPDGKVHRVLDVEEKEDSVRFLVKLAKPEHFSIPVSEVELVWIRKLDVAKTIGFVVGGLVLAYGATMLIVLAFKESCPFVYSFDGRDYVFDAEPYGGAICHGLQRTEWCDLEHLRPTGGNYRIKVTNEVNETQYTDELKLIAVDHEPGTRIVADEAGVVHTFAHALPPERAWNQDGRSIQRWVAADDPLLWLTPEADLDPARRSDLKDELTFEFAKPGDARIAKLLFKGCNTLWASQMLRRFLELQGDGIGAHYRKLNEPGPFRQALLNWHGRAEMMMLQVKVETPLGWRQAATIFGGGPFAMASRAYVLDVSDIPGDTLRVRLTPPAGFWMINRIAIDYSPDEPVQVTELAAIQGNDSREQDVLGALSRTDGRYLVMPEIGDEALLMFAAPPLKKGMRRTVLLKASGYYDIHLDPQGPPQAGLLGRFREDPTAAIEYSLQEYLRWRQETRARREPPESRLNDKH